MNKAIWILFDFGLKGDYKSLYTWLDNYGAIECGQNMAFLKYPSDNVNSESSTSIYENVKKDFTDEVKLSKNDRVYLIYKDELSSKMKGKWLNGNRKAAPWEGYGKLESQQTEDEGE